jgi:predicted N-acetyltransferase YhbS
MKFDLISSPSFTIRPLETADEIDAFFRLNTQIFRPDKDLEITKARRQKFILEEPEFEHTRLRGAFLENTYLGGYVLLERQLRLGLTQLRTCYISGIVTHPAYIGQGIGTALTRDVINYGLVHQYDLFLGHGIPNFYDRFDFIDIFDTTKVAINCNDILAHPTSPYYVRPATSNDVVALLALHQSHYGSYNGSFFRSLKQQEHLLSHWLADEALLLVLSPDDQPSGYLLLSTLPSTDRSYASEVAANDWLAVLALLQYHTHLLDTIANSPREIWWPLPLNSPTFYLLADHLPVYSQTYHLPNEDWMARPAHLLTLIQSLFPLWQDRWANDGQTGTDTLVLKIDNHMFLLDLIAKGVLLIDRLPANIQTISLDMQVFTQLLFGYRPATWAIHQSNQRIPKDLLPLLETLFPCISTWIPESDTGLDHLEELRD